MKNVKKNFLDFYENGMPRFDLTSKIPMPSVLPLRQESSSSSQTTSSTNSCVKKERSKRYANNYKVKNVRNNIQQVNHNEQSLDSK